MALPATTTFDLTEEWAEIGPGPLAADLRNGFAAEVLFADLEAPPLPDDRGHLLSNQPGHNASVNYGGALTLYARAAGCDQATLVVTGA